MRPYKTGRRHLLFRTKPRTDLSGLPVRSFLKRGRTYLQPSWHPRLLGFWLILLVVVVLNAQTQNSTVFGRVIRQNNQPATRVLVSIATKITYTDDGGRYRIDGVPLGVQEMLVSSGGVVLLKADVKIISSEQRIDKKLP